MFLKLLDDMDKVAEDEALLSGEKYVPVIEAPYRWRDWACMEDGITGDELINFVNQEKTIRPDGTEGLGLLAYRKGLNHDGKSRKDVIGNIFSGTVNRMINGYLLSAFCGPQWPPVRLPVATRRCQWTGLISYFSFDHYDVMFRHPFEKRVGGNLILHQHRRPCLWLALRADNAAP
jgi:hypothetical protein